MPEITSAEKLQNDKDRVFIKGYDELLKEYNRLKDENDKQVSDAQKICESLQVQAEELEKKIAGMEEQFKAEYAQKIRNLDDREVKIIANEKLQDAKERDLSTRKSELDAFENVLITKNQAILDETKVLINNNNALSADIYQTQRETEKQKERNSDLLKEIAIEKAAAIRSQALADQKIENLQELQNEVLAQTEHVNTIKFEAEKTWQSVQDKERDVQRLLDALHTKEEANTKKMNEVNLALKACESKKAEIQSMLDEQQKNLENLGTIGAQNKTEAIALRTLQVDLNNKDRELREREANVKKLEEKVVL